MGGNIFIQARPIKRENIKPTLLEFFKELTRIFPNAGKYFRQMKTLGSVGKKDISGDIDLALSGDAFKDIKEWDLDEKNINDLFQNFKKKSRTASEEQLMKRAVIVAIAQKIEEEGENIGVDTKGSGSGALFLAYPQYTEDGTKLDDSVQIDINVGDVDWLSFAYYSDPYQGVVKGLHRTQLMLALFTEAGYTFSHNYGVKDKETQEVVATSPSQAIELLNRLYSTRINSDILSNYFKLQEYIKTHIPTDKLNSIYDRLLKILDSTRADIPEDLQQYWVDNQQRLGLKGTFLPDNSNLKKYAIQ
jgi:hypothetical protein